MESYAGTQRPATIARRRVRERFGGPEGNEILTIAAASVLTVLLMAEGITLLRLNSLLSAHMFLGLVLIPPVLLKIATTGYRFVRYYTNSRPYVAKGPPALPLRMLAPVLVLSTIGIFITGIWLLLLGHKSDQVVFLHQASFAVWAFCFGIHFLAYLPRVLTSLLSDWRGARTHRVHGSGLRGMLVAASLGAGLALAISLAGAIGGWHGSPSG
ncbi:MAG: hypothetical protein ACM33U_02905 [Solirubrobacterales bacterium]|nr:hypothetical protein [Solirubrobacterales bacterium]